MQNLDLGKNIIPAFQASAESGTGLAVDPVFFPGIPHPPLFSQGVSGSIPSTEERGKRLLKKTFPLRNE